MANETKWCPRCEAELPVGEFYINKGRHDGLSPICVTHQLQADTDRRSAMRTELFALLGNGCAIKGCPNDDPRGWCVDHVNGGGKAERDNGLTSAHRAFVEKVRNSPGEYQILCAYHNQIKKVEEKEHTGRRVYSRQTPTEKKPMVGRGNGVGQKEALARSRTPEHQANAGRAKKGRPQPNVAAARTGTKKVQSEDGSWHWSRPGDPDYPVTILL